MLVLNFNIKQHSVRTLDPRPIQNCFSSSNLHNLRVCCKKLLLKCRDQQTVSAELRFIQSCLEIVHFKGGYKCEVANYVKVQSHTKLNPCTWGHSITTWTRWGVAGDSKIVCFCPRSGYKNCPCMSGWSKDGKIPST